VTEQIDIHFRIDFEGRWFGPDGNEVNEASLFFLSQNLRFDGEGYFIALGYGPAKLSVEDVPFVIKALSVVEGKERYLSLALSDNTEERLVPETLARKGEYYYCLIRGGNIPARFSKDAQKTLEEYLVREGDEIFLSL
jgi:hypothetical protein